MKSIRAVAVAIHKDKILLMRRIKERDEFYVLPGGGVEENETVEEAVIREIIEEASLKIEIKKLVYRHFYDDNSEQFFYLCDYISGEPKLGEGNELEEMRTSDKNFYEPLWFEIKNLPNLLLYPLEIRDWIIEDSKNNFSGSFPKKATLKVSDLRQEI